MYGQYTVSPMEECVNFGVGQPSNSELPLDIIKTSCKHIQNISDFSLLQYGDIPGYKAFRTQLAQFLETQLSNSVEPDNLFITNGITGAVSLICSLYRKSINKIYVEEPTYFLMINIFKEFGFKVESIPMEDDGIDINILKSKLRKNPDEKAIVYTIPVFHNPTGITMSHQKRKLLSQMSLDYKFIILADEVYQLLNFSDDFIPPPPLYYYGGYTYSLGSFSKILAPSLRLGWIHTSYDMLEPLLKCGQLDSSGGINPFISRIVHNVIESGDMENYLNTTRKRLEKRCDTLCDRLNDFTFVKPKGGYFLWIDLDNNSLKFLEYCQENDGRVKFHTGNKFSYNGKLKNCIRLSFSYYDHEGLKIGAQRLSTMYNKYISPDKITVYLNGHTGKLGKKINILLNPQIYNVIPITYCLEAIKDCNNSSIIIDVTNSDGNEVLLTHLLALDFNIPLLIGTTGKLNNSLIEKYANNAPVAKIANFSYGIPVLEKILREYKFLNWDITIEELHHSEKIDKPSGTAKLLKNAIGNSDIKINSIRQGDIYGIHKITVENDDEKIVFYHEAKSRDIFAKGCIRFINILINKDSGLYNSEDDLNQINKHVFKTISGSGNTFNICEFIQSKNVLKYLAKVNNVDGVINIIFHPDDSKYDFTWNYYNRDLTNVEMCGNGSRCAAHYAAQILNKKELKFTNNFGINQTAYVDGDIVKVLMPNPKDFKWSNLNIMLNKYDNLGYFVIVGVQHYVKEVNDIDKYNLKKLYDYVNSFGSFKTNVNIYQKIDEVIHIRTFEKGVERETGACGTGCCAVVAGLDSNKYPVNYKFKTSSGEFLNVSIDNFITYLSGSVRYI